MSDPLWFLENLEDSESKDSQKDKDVTSEIKNINPISELDGLTLDYNQDSDLKYFDEESNQGKEFASLESNQIETGKGSFEDKNLESSIFNLSKDGNNELDIPEIKISINTENLKKLLGEDSLVKDPITVEPISQTTEEGSQPKIYVILNDKNGGAPGAEGQEKKFYTEVGSTVINLNDLIPSESQLITGDEKITTAVKSVDTDGNNGNKVELVITVKDLRKNKSGKNEKLWNNRRNAPSDQYVNSTLSRFRGRNENSYDSSETWETAKYSGKDKNDWTEETRDSYIREGDGARCYRTVTITPEGKRVKTECYRGEKTVRRPGYDRLQNRNHSYGRNGSIWQEIDDEFNHLFSSARRFFSF